MFEAAFGWLAICLPLAAVAILAYFPLAAAGVSLRKASWVPMLLLSLAISGFAVNMAQHLFTTRARPSLFGDIVIVVASVAAALIVALRVGG